MLQSNAISPFGVDAEVDSEADAEVNAKADAEVDAGIDAEVSTEVFLKVMGRFTYVEVLFLGYCVKVDDDD